MMDIDLSAEAIEFGRAARRALEAAGGDELVQRAEADPAVRESVIEPVLAELGAWELDPRGDADELEAAAALCRAVGYWAAPYPVAERLAGVVVVADTNPAGLGGSSTAVTLDGRRFPATAAPAGPPRTTTFVTALELGRSADADPIDLPLGLTLPCWTLLGMLDRAVELTRDHIVVREQFGAPLSALQGVQFQLTEAEVERGGVEMLARYALWSVQEGLPEAVDDALALRLAAIEAAEVVFRIAHQLHGATGFCDETTLSWVSRYSQPLRRLPLGVSATRDALTRRIGRRGLTGLFSDV
jgi:hypothetical protein